MPAAQLRMESAPRYSTAVTVALSPPPEAKRSPCEVKRMSSGLTPRESPTPRPGSTTGPALPAITAPPGESASDRIFMGGVPMKRAAKTLAGRA